MSASIFCKKVVFLSSYNLSDDLLSLGHHSIANCMAAIEQYKKDPNNTIIFNTGYCWMPGQIESSSSMQKKLLIANGILEKDIITLDLMDQWDKIDEFYKRFQNKDIEIYLAIHKMCSPRHKMIFRKMGYKNINYLNPKSKMDFNEKMMEIIRIIVTLFDRDGKSFFVKKERNRYKK